jgi:hypothetical protein
MRTIKDNYKKDDFASQLLPKTMDVKEVEFEKGKLVNISEIKNYPKLDTDNKEIKHTAELAHNENVKYILHFFKNHLKT